MGKDFTATISGNSERAETWRWVLGTETICIKSPYPAYANLPGKPNVGIYELDLSLLTDDQRERLIRYISEKFDIPLIDVANDLDEIGCPVLTEDVRITIHNPQKWFA